MPVRRLLARCLVRGLLRPGLAPRHPLAKRRATAEREARLLPVPRGVRRRPAGEENPGGEWLLPAGTEPDHPGGAWLYVHGGGFLLGSPATHRSAAAILACASGLPVLAARYRLAPEHPFPAALEDVQAAWRHVTQGGARPVALAGDSAGAWLALALAQYAPAAGLSCPAALTLFSPLLDLAAAEHETDDDVLLPPGFVAEGARAFRGGLPAGDPRLDLLGADLSGLPPTFISFDHDEALADHARRLAAAARAAGATVRVEEAEGLWHAWPLLAGLLPEGRATLEHAAAYAFPPQGARR